MHKLQIGGHTIYPGERKNISLHVGKLYDSTDLSMPVHIIRGQADGPIIFLSAAIHGNEINGLEIIREVLNDLLKMEIKGSVIAVPIVNAFGLNNRSRYLPDRKDLNRCFPGSKKGSLGKRTAYLFMKEIVSQCTHGIDFHTGSVHRHNLPQIRADLSDLKTYRFAKHFGAPIIINAKERDGSLREAARKKGVLTLLFEGGEALRFSNQVIRVGRRGCLNVLKAIGMIEDWEIDLLQKPPIIAHGSYWIRSPMGGILRLKTKAGSFVKKGAKIGEIIGLLGEKNSRVYTKEEGHIVGVNKLPLVTEGEAIVHIATTQKHKNLQENLFENL